MSPLSILGIGLLLGMRHATDADHVVAVSTIVSTQKNIFSSTLIGALWGIGHTITVFLVGSLIIIFHIVIPPRIGLTLEFFVAIALIVLGIMSLTGILETITQKLTHGTHTHIHLFSHHPHIHMHEHESPTMPEESGKTITLKPGIFDRLGAYQIFRPLVVELIHGLAGSAAIALLILGSISNPLVALVYLLIFGIGTIIGMMMITTAIGLPIVFSLKRFTSLHKSITIISGIISLSFGLFLAYEIGIQDHLFGQNPVWEPR
ncbi:high-affinity nickel-transport family protein [Candidatus Gottesmanbacteria bacterium]|nr:high-affinity nickel-transport family protein [Candidatus Gottesmanbacteria bacterium]